MADWAGLLDDGASSGMGSVNFAPIGSTISPARSTLGVLAMPSISRRSVSTDLTVRTDHARSWEETPRRYSGGSVLMVLITAPLASCTVAVDAALLRSRHICDAHGDGLILVVPLLHRHRDARLQELLALRSPRDRASAALRLGQDVR